MPAKEKATIAKQSPFWLVDFSLLVYFSECHVCDRNSSVTKGNSHRKCRKQLKEACNGNGGFGFKSFHACGSEMSHNGEKQKQVRRETHFQGQSPPLALSPVPCPLPCVPFSPPFSPFHLWCLLTISSGLDIFTAVLTCNLLHKMLWITCKCYTNSIKWNNVTRCHFQGKCLHLFFFNPLQFPLTLFCIGFGCTAQCPDNHIPH